MPETPRRRFTLFDGMVLIAATAVGIACFRALWGSFEISLPRPHSLAAWLELFLTILVVGWPMLAIWTVAILFLRLLKPRPRRLLLTRQPGLIACVAVVTAIALVVSLVVGIGLIGWVLNGTMQFVWSDFDSSTGVELFIFVMPIIIQIGVLGAWGTLALTGRWRSERSWIDRVGRLLGVVWVVILPVIVILLLEAT